jgi:putative phosphoribosyl transferase
MASPSEHRLGPHSPSEYHAAARPGPPAFADRTEAGVLLGAALREARRRSAPGDSERLRAGPGRAASPGEADGAPPRVFALPRGGVPVGAGVARALNASLDVLMVRKIGHPEEPELGLGAIAEDGGGGAAEPFFDPEMLRRVGLAREDLAEVVARERAELARRVAVYRRPAAAGEAGSGPARAADLAGRLVVVVDDGLATGVTARAALRAVRARGAARTVLAVPVAARAAVEAVQEETDEVVTLVTPRRFRSVGEWYVDFGQLTDADVLAMLSSSGQTAAAGGRPPNPPRCPRGRD